MVKYAFALWMAPLFAAAVSLYPAAAQQGSANSLNQIQSHLRALTTMTANFNQRDRAGQSLSGKLTLKQPGRIRFQYQKGVGLLIVGDGKALTVIDYDVRQVQRWPIKNSPLGALLNPDRDLSKYGTLKPTTNPNVLSVEVRDPKRPEYGTLTMVFTKIPSAPAGLRLDGWVSVDSKNNRTSIRLSNQKFGAVINNKTFRWRDPRPKGPRRR